MCLSAITAMGQNKENTSLFGRELTLSAGTAYPLTGHIEKYELNFNFSAQGYINKYFGAEVSVPLFRKDATVFEEFSIGPLLRFPVSKRLALYGSPGITYNWRAEDFDYYTKLGVEFRPFKRVSVFTEGTYKIGEIGSFENGNYLIGGGLRLILH